MNTWHQSLQPFSSCVKTMQPCLSTHFDGCGRVGKIFLQFYVNLLRTACCCRILACTVSVPRHSVLLRWPVVCLMIAYVFMPTSVASVRRCKQKFRCSISFHAAETFIVDSTAPQPVNISINFELTLFQNRCII
jgi:hypothetical protein